MKAVRVLRVVLGLIMVYLSTLITRGALNLQALAPPGPQNRLGFYLAGLAIFLGGLWLIFGRSKGDSSGNA